MYLDNKNSNSWVHAHTCMHARTHACMSAHTCTHMHAHTHKHTHTHARTYHHVCLPTGRSWGNGNEENFVKTERFPRKIWNTLIPISVVAASGSTECILCSVWYNAISTATVTWCIAPCYWCLFTVWLVCEHRGDKHKTWQSHYDNYTTVIVVCVWQFIPSCWPLPKQCNFYRSWPRHQQLV